MDDFSEHDEASSGKEDNPAGPTEFCVFVAAEPSFFKKLFKKVDTTPAVSKVVKALESLVAKRVEFQDAEWS